MTEQVGAAAAINEPQAAEENATVTAVDATAVVPDEELSPEDRVLLQDVR